MHPVQLVSAGAFPEGEWKRVEERMDFSLLPDVNYFGAMARNRVVQAPSFLSSSSQSQLCGEQVASPKGVWEGAPVEGGLTSPGKAVAREMGVRGKGALSCRRRWFDARLAGNDAIGNPERLSVGASKGQEEDSK